MTHPLLEISDLTVYFSTYSNNIFKSYTGCIRSVDGVSLKVYPGEVLGLAGESGCGKSTLARCIMRLVQPTSGSIIFKNKNLLQLNQSDLRLIRPHIQMIFQDPYSSLNPRMTIYDILREAMTLRVDSHSFTQNHFLKEISDLLQDVGLDDTALKKYPHEFSGGQCQRIAIARALAPNPELIIADEPVSALDVSIQSQILNLIKSLCRKRNLTLLFIGHDLSVLKYLCDRIAIMYLGKIMEVGEAASVIETPLHPYTKALVSAIPIPDPLKSRDRNRLILSGELPSNSKPIAGCVFHSRCPYSIEKCTLSSPLLTAPSPEMHPVACIRAKDIQ